MVRGRPVSALEKIDAADAFNLGKGDLQVNSSGGNTVVIAVNRISERAIMKVTMTFARPELDPATVRRTAKILVPFDFAAYEEACYSRP